jgi:uncharacterized protein YkwD
MPRRCLPGLFLILFLVAADKSDIKDAPSLSADEKTILDLTNKARTEQKLPPLTVDPILTSAARAYSAKMAAKGEMSHFLDGTNPAQRVKAAGYDYSWTGENLAEAENVTVPEVFEGWMKSKAHRDNILKEEYRDIGIGIARDDKGKIYYTQEFGKKRRK